MLSSRDVTIKPTGNILIDDASEVTDAGNLKNDNSVVFVQNADVHQNLDNLAGKQGRLDYPEGLQWAAPIDRTLQRIEQTEIIRKSQLAAKIITDSVPSHSQTSQNRTRSHSVLSPLGASTT